MIIAVADIHGYADKLYELMLTLDKKGYTIYNTDFVFLGDYIDGGPGSYQVVETIGLMKIKSPRVTLLKGNHEDLMLDAIVHGGRRYHSYDLWWSQGGRETFQSYASALYPDATPYEKALMSPHNTIPKEHLDLFDSLPTMHESKNFYFVHGGFLPELPPQQTSDMDRMWLRDQFIRSHYNWGKRVIFGHTYHRDPIAMSNKVGIDTMHHGGGMLTSIILDDDASPDDAFVYEYVRV